MLDVAAFLPNFPAEHRSALEALLSAASSPTALGARLRALAEPLAGGRAYSWDAIGLGVADMVIRVDVAKHGVSPRQLERYVQGAAERLAGGGEPSQASDRPNGGSKGALAALATVQALIEERQVPGRPPAKIIPADKVKLLGARTAEAYRLVGGAKRILAGLEGEDISFLHRDWEKAWKEAGQ